MADQHGSPAPPEVWAEFEAELERYGKDYEDQVVAHILAQREQQKQQKQQEK